jgi:hypothetical protein
LVPSVFELHEALFGFQGLEVRIDS